MAVVCLGTLGKQGGEVFWGWFVRNLNINLRKL